MNVRKQFIKWLEITYAEAQGRFKKNTPHRKGANPYQLRYFDLVKKQLYPRIAHSKNTK